METKKDILLRTYFVFLGLTVFCVAIISKVLYIQLAEGEYWRKMADNARVRMVEIEAERGSIFSEDEFVLSTSIPEFDIYVDYMADGLREKEGVNFKNNLDSLAIGLSGLFKDKNAAAYRKALKAGYSKGERYSLLKRKISFTEYEAMKKLPLVKLGRNKSGFIAEVRMKRLYPFKLMANRTIGIARESNKVGLEKQYDANLSGVTGRRLVRFISGGAGMPVDDAMNTDPNDGSDIITTLDVGIQDIAHQALERMMIENEALQGTCIVMEVATGKIRAIANLGRQADGSYWEDYNYALSASEPGSTWKLTTLMAVLEDKKVSLNSPVNLEGGRWQVAGQVVFDSEIHGLHEATIQQAFEKSSNVGMAKLTHNYYSAQPSKYFSHLHKWHMDSITGIDLPGEGRPKLYKPGSKQWSKTTLPWMGFGYNLAITPLQTAMLYNAVANGGKMMKPYLVNAVVKEGEVIKRFEPEVLEAAVCSPETLAQVKTCLEGVVLRGTAHRLQTPAYTFAGKTGTSLVADKGISYADKMYQSSFAGYFPADKPEYTIVVVIRNKKHAPKFYGGVVAGPVFREVADRLYAGYLQQPRLLFAKSNDSVNYQFRGVKQTLERVATGLKMPYRDSSGLANVATLGAEQKNKAVMKGEVNGKGTMPELKGIGLKDALEVCEMNGWKVIAKGKGKVSDQSVPAGTILGKGEKVILTLN
jgi:cell division protein FtsI (penicillin-binding protein 3)